MCVVISDYAIKLLIDRKGAHVPPSPLPSPLPHGSVVYYNETLLPGIVIFSLKVGSQFRCKALRHVASPRVDARHSATQR